MKYITTVNGQTFEIDINENGKIVIDGQERAVDFQEISAALYSALIENRSIEALVEERDGIHQVQILGGQYDVQVIDERRYRLSSAGGGFSAGSGELTIRSPMPGLIVDVRVTEGQEVAAGASLVVLESMKMENEIKAPRAGTVARISVGKGESVEQNRALLVLT